MRATFLATPGVAARTVLAGSNASPLHTAERQAVAPNGADAARTPCWAMGVWLVRLRAIAVH